MNEITSKSDTTTEFITEIRDAFKEQLTSPPLLDVGLHSNLNEASASFAKTNPGIKPSNSSI